MHLAVNGELARTAKELVLGVNKHPAGFEIGYIACKHAVGVPGRLIGVNNRTDNCQHADKIFMSFKHKKNKIFMINNFTPNIWNKS